MRTLRIKAVMTRKVIVVTEGTSFGDTVDLMVRHRGWFRGSSTSSTT